MRRDLATRFVGLAPDERGSMHPPELVYAIDGEVKGTSFLERLWALHWKKKLTLFAAFFLLYGFTSALFGDWLIRF